MQASDFLLAACAVLYGALFVLLMARGRRVTPLLLGVCCLVTAGWAVVSLGSVGGGGLPGRAATTADVAELVRALAWFWFMFYLYHDAQLGRRRHEAGFAIAGLLAAGLGVTAMVEPATAPAAGALFSMGIMARLGIAVVELLLIENLYLNLPEHLRWHVALPSMLLGGLACFDILLCADLVLFHEPSAALWGSRTLAMIMIAPLLGVAGVRGQRWKGKVKLSRAAVFHSATLLLSGSVLLALGLAGEVFRQFGANWGWLAEVSLGFAALIAIALVTTSGSARSRFQRLFVDHFFAERFDYRRQWQACTRTLSGDDGEVVSALGTRAVRTVVSVVDSPAGILFLRDGGAGPFAWAGSWNLPAMDAIPADHPIVAAVRNGCWIARLDGPAQGGPAQGGPEQGGPGRRLTAAPLDEARSLWLAVPLVHRGVLIGLVLAAEARAPFELGHEVFELLRIVAKEVATTIAEQRATQRLIQTKELQDYGNRFAFVAHDIKNVSSQLALLLSNAESHLANPEFQKDMLETVRSSVRKITALLQRLEQPEAAAPGVALAPLPRLEALVATYLRVRRAQLVLEHDGSSGSVAMGADAFETAITHLLNNAVEAAAGSLVVVRVRHEARQVVVEIADRGAGMTPEFVRDRLFRPFSTSKAGGSGIGAYQSRELVQAAGGALEVASEPGRGTTMRLLLPRTDVWAGESAAGAVAVAALPGDGLSRAALSRVGA